MGKWKRRKDIPGKENSNCKGSEVRTCSVKSKKGKVRLVGQSEEVAMDPAPVPSGTRD